MLAHPALLAPLNAVVGDRRCNATETFVCASVPIAGANATSQERPSSEITFLGIMHSGVSVNV